MTVSPTKWLKFLNTHLPWILIIILVAIQSNVSDNSSTHPLEYSDKLVHFTIFGVLGWLFARAIFKTDNNFLKRNYFIMVLIFVTIFAITDEIHQSFVPGRDADVFDLVADISGALLFLLIFSRKKSLRD